MRSPGSLLALCLVLFLVSGRGLIAAADPGVYEPGVDPGVGFNLVSWANFGSAGASVWENAVQSAHDAGFDEVSLSPVRFYTIGSGSIATTSSSGPALNHVAAGVARAKSLGMRVTVNPFVEPVGFSTWRGFYDPTPGSGEWNTFWNDYENYLVDVAQMAETGGADSMTVGTELRAITRNSGNNAQWASVISAVDAEFTGTLGYAANWDNYNNNNVRNTIWENPAIDYIGIDAYFTGLLNNSQADASGAYPNQTFITQVETAWNNRLDNQILPFAAARKGGAGMPVEFTEVGYLPYNRTTVTPQNSSGPLDQDEQNMAFEGLMRALDGRGDDFLATHIWQWNMPGSNGSLWNFDPDGGNQPSNQQTAQWLSDFVTNSGNPGGSSPGAGTQVLYSFETGLEGFFYPNFEPAEPASQLALSAAGATDGAQSLAITKPTDTWTWDSRVQMSGDQLQALQDALANGDANYELEIDVTYAAGDLPANLTSMDLHVSIETNLDGWNQIWPLAAIGTPIDATLTAAIPLEDFNLSAGISSANLHLGFQGNFTGDATVYVDRIALVDLTAVEGDFDGDGDVDTADLVAWQRGDSPNSGSAADLAAWQNGFTTSTATAAFDPVPEPATLMLLAFAGCGLIASRRLF
ncbi:MAG: glycoside hydrolase TIM-barrel-like domain-containing protein [Planctomycetota bacterium]